MPTPIDLPELCLLISKTLSLSDLANCVQVCKNWRNNFGVDFAMRLFAAWRQLDTTACSENVAAKRASLLKQRGIVSEEQLWWLERHEEPMSPRFRACAHLNPMPPRLVSDFRKFGHLIRKLKVNRAWPFSDPTTFCPGLERLHVDVEKVTLKRVSRGCDVEDEDQYQHLVNQAMVCIAQTHSLQYLYLRVHTHNEVRAVIRWQQQSPLENPHPPYLPLLTAADICGPVEPSFVDTLLAGCPRLRRLSLLGNHPSLHLSYPIAVRSPLEELTISIRQPTWHALHWATKLPHLRQLTVLLKSFAGTSRLPTFHRLTSLAIQEIEQHHHYRQEDEGQHTHDGMARLLKAIPIGQLKHLSLQASGDVAWRTLLVEHVLPHAKASLLSLSLQVGDDDENPTTTTGFISRDFWEAGRRFVAMVLEQAPHLQLLKANCPLDATEGLLQPWACAATLEHLEVVLIYPCDKSMMRHALQRIATCRRLRRLWTTTATSMPTGMVTTTTTTSAAMAADATSPLSAPSSPTTLSPSSTISSVSSSTTSSTSSSNSSTSSSSSSSSSPNLTSTSSTYMVDTAMLDLSLSAGQVQELESLTQLESISLYWRGPDLVEDRLGEAEAEWMATHFPNLKEIVGLHVPLCREFHRRMMQLRSGLTFRRS
ncbi:hypothetical protein DFQ26_008930 [Actinomortierella ambigua]|nr:hypothetical protein DFQ26_008930 [Actinomortierella ambigua]